MNRELTPEESARIIANNDPVRIFTCGILFGAAVGIVLGVLYAPQKGEETRKQIREKVETTAKMVQDKTEEIKEKVLEAADDIDAKAEEIKKRGEESLRVLKGL
jgi:gas vesicle protein